jgi:hypothetical protein
MTNSSQNGCSNGGMSEGVLPEPVRAWVQEVADRDHGGNWGAAASAILEAAYEAERSPDRWAYLEARVRGRSGK